MAESTSPTGENPPRLFITKMVLENFKSYGGEREVGPFHKRFSSIVGPNGSGKSNVIDAMLFVFGKKAKKLRLNKVSELIHKSDTMPNLDFCRVSVHFCDIIDTQTDEDAFQVVPGTELVVTRLAYKNNTSKYLVDGKVSNFKEVGALLRKRGIDLDNNRFLILQGEVEQIAMMPPKAKTEHDEGLLEFLEDIIGSNRHLEAITAAEKELEVLNEERADKLARLKVTETERDNLEGAKSEAEACVRKGREVRNKQNVLYQKHAVDATALAAEMGSNHAELSERKAYEDSKLKEKQGELHELEAKGVALSEEHGKIVAELEKAKKEFSSFERQDIKLREDVKHNKATLKKLTATVKAEEAKAAEATSKAEKCAASVPGLEAAVVKAQGKRTKEEAAMEKLLEAAKAETEALRGGLEEKQAAIAPVKQQVSEVEASIGTTETEIKLVTQAATNAQQEYAKVEKELDRLSKEREAKAKELGQSGATQAKLEARAAAAEQSEEALKGKEKELKQRTAHAVAAVEEGRAALAAAQEASNRKGGGVVGALMAQTKKGKPLANAGVIGRLGDLGRIDEKYDVAVSTACGSLDYLVVETEAGGAQCIEYLRRNNIGRVSLIVLERMGKSAQQLQQPFKAPQKSERLFDCIAPSDPRLAPAFFFALRNTLVAKDLEIATAIAFEGSRPVHRVVTLAGDLIDTSGAMSGGGGRVKSGGMLFKSSAAASSSSSSSSLAAAAAGGGAGASDEEVTPAMVAALEKEAKKASDELAACRLELTNKASEKQTVANELRALRKSLPKLEMAVASADESLPRLSSRLDNLASQCKVSPEDAKRVKELEAAVAKARKDSAGIAKTYAALQADIDELQAKIVNAGGEPVKQQRRALANAVKAHDEAEAAVVAAGVDAKDCTKAAGKAANTAAKAQQELEGVEAKLTKATEELKALEGDAEVVMEAFKAAQSAAKEKEKEVHAVKKEMEDARKLVDKIKLVQVDIDNQLHKYTTELKENQRKAKHWETEVARLNEQHAQDLADWGELADPTDDDEEDEEEEEESPDSGAAASSSSSSTEGSGDAMAVGDDGEGTGQGEGTEEGAASSPEGGEDVYEQGKGKQEEEEEESAPKRRAGKRGAASAAAATAAACSKKAAGRKGATSAGAVVLKVFTPEQLARYDNEALKYELLKLEEERDKLKKSVNMGAIAEYRAKQGEYKERFGDLEQCTVRRDEKRTTYEDLRRQRLDEFMSGFSHITLKLKEMYQMITLGGDAELELVDSLDPFSEGIVFSVRPPKKSWKNIANLSGGEKTLSSLALVFALHHYKPTPLYVMDEIDAALDFKNVSIVANYIKERTKNAQFVIISLRNNMFELADRLVGIYKTNNTTKSVTINPKLFAQADLKAPPLPGASVGGDLGNGVQKLAASPLGDRTNSSVPAMR